MRKLSLNEIMGSKMGSTSKSRDLTLADLPDLLGEQMPHMQFSPVGRYRLQNALRKRFGDNYMNLPGVNGIMKEFDDNAKFAVKMQEMKMIKGKGK